MSETDASGSSLSSAGGSSLASDNTDTRALANTVQEGADGDAADDIDANNKSIQEGVFATLFTLTKNKTFDQSVRIAILRVVLEFLQLFRVIFNSSFPWTIQRDLWIFKAIEWILFRMVVAKEGYSTYVAVFYFLAALILGSLLLTIWVAVMLKGDDAVNPWLKRLIMVLQLLGFMVYCIWWPAILDFITYVFDCNWTNLSQGLPATHVRFTEQSCTAMPHLAHMLFAGVMIVILAAMVLLMSAGICDSNPLNANLLSCGDVVTCIKVLVLKLLFVLVSTALDELSSAQAVLMLVFMAGVVYYLLDGAPHYNLLVNITWGGLSLGLLSTTGLLVGIQLTAAQQQDPTAFTRMLSALVLPTIFPAVALGAGLMWLRLWHVQRLAGRLAVSLASCKAAVAVSMAEQDMGAKAGSGCSMLALMGHDVLRKVHRFRDARQVLLVARRMRVWDEDGLVDPAASEFGEFVLKCGMARLPNNAPLLVAYSNFLIEARKDGQAARTQLQLAAKASPSVLDNFFIFVTAQLAKQLKRDGDGLDLMSYVEYQRNYRGCVRAHKLALMAQRQFWNSLLRDKVAFKDMQACFKLMEEAEQRATTVYRRVLERYPGNGRILKVYGRFLEFVRNEPGAAARFYEAALKAGTTESLLALTAGEEGAAGLSAAGPIDEKVDGLVIINAQGIIMMVNAAAVAMFGYEKNELEAKNVSVLMPQPFSYHHDSFLKRYVDCGKPRIIGKVRSMIGLRKDRSMFPISLCAARLSGVGADTLFIGVIRPAQPPVSEHTIVRFWTTRDGIIMCSDSTVSDALGLDPPALVGRSFSNLCMDVEGVNRFVAGAIKQTEEADGMAAVDELPTFRTKVLHGFLPPVDVELSMQFGGAVDATSDYRSISIQARLLAEAAAVLVLDHKGRGIHATAKLANLLGHSVAALTKMDLNALLPQPFCQMHGAWFKDPPTRPTATSCRAGGVVHLLAANGTKTPVTLKMSQREDAATGHMTHVIQVTKATEEQRLDQQRLLLGINHKGIILSVNASAPRALFGFDAASTLVGMPLATCIDIFGAWAVRFGEDASLLALLVGQAMRAGSGAGAEAGRGGVGTDSDVCSSWRVGVHKPEAVSRLAASGDGAAATGGSTGEALAATGGSTGSVLMKLQHRQLLPACMKLEVLAQEVGDLLMDEALADATPVLQVSLHRSDALTCVLELDSHMRVARADEAAGLLFGVSGKQLYGKPIARLLGLPSSTSFDDLLGGQGGAAAKKGAMKGATAAGAARTGSIKSITARHLGDHKALLLSMQALSYERASKTRMLVRLQPLQPSSAALDRLLALKQGSAAATPADNPDEAAAAVHSSPDGPHSPRSSSRLSGPGDGAEAAPAAEQSHEHVGHHPHHSRDVVGEWVRQASRLPVPHDAGPDSPRHGAQPGGPLSSRPAAGSRADGDAHVAVHIARRGHGTPAAADEDGDSEQHWGPAQRRGGNGKAPPSDSEEEEEEQQHSIGLSRKPSIAAPSSDGATSAAGGGSMVGSMVDGSEAGASETAGSTSAGGDMGHDEDLAVDTRRAKRLKKLHRILGSGTVQAAHTTWRRHTLVLLAIVCAAHIACFVVLTTQIESRYANAVAVNNIGMAMATSSQTVLRSNFLQKCSEPMFAGFSVCTPAQIASYGDKMLNNAIKFSGYHSQLFLGVGSLQPFKDWRLLDFWTYKQLPEVLYYEAMGGLLPATVNSTRTLWEMGNVMVAAVYDVYYHRNEWVGDMDAKPSWQYTFNNGPASIFSGYAWSLDTFVDYTWRDLTTLSSTIIILLVVEAVLVQLTSMAYEFYLLQRCNVSHMRMFSVFLALPSATVRLMARKAIVVDDSTKDDLEDDDFDLVEGPGGGGAVSTANADAAGAGGEGAATTDRKKSVRLAAELSDDDDAADGDAKRKGAKGKAKAKEGSKPSKAKGKLLSSKPSKAPLTGLAGLRKKLEKALFGWLDPRFKKNGKRLLPCNQVLLHFMGPLLLWVAAVVVIYAVSFDKLQGLQGPLASLDLSAHVLYRMTRCRLSANLLGFSTAAADNAQHRAELKDNLALLRSEYTTLLYGGRMLLQANVTFDATAPAAVFSDSSISDLFFQTKDCLRADQSGCYKPGDEFYDITHAGLDAQVNRYLDEMTTFANLPDELAWANHSAYVFTSKVTATDTYDGLQRSSLLFVQWTLSRLESVRQLHIILLAISLACMVLFVLLLYRPYITRTRHDARAVACMLSLLPAEVDVEGQVKAIVLGITKAPDAAGNRSMPPSEMLGAPFGGPYGGMMGAPGQGMGMGMLLSGGGGSGMMGPSQRGGKLWGGGGGGNGWAAHPGGGGAPMNDPHAMYGGAYNNPMAMQRYSDMA